MPGSSEQRRTDPDLRVYCRRALEAGATNVRQIRPADVVTAPWVRLKCRFGCPGYDRGHCCPPHTPTPAETREILDSYQRALLFHIAVPHMPHKERHYRVYFDRLTDLEGEMFKDGFYRAFLMLAGPCRICERCARQEEKPCSHPYRARPSMEACGIDVYQTARDCGFFIQPLRDKTETNNEYCLMLVD